jgi:hypothetical protein
MRLSESEAQLRAERGVAAAGARDAGGAPWGILMGAGLFALLTFFGRPVWASPNWYLELPEELVSETTARRTLALELREVQVPADPLREGDQARFVQLHVSVSPEAPSGESERPEFLVVEVWDRGQSAGRRRISAHGHPSTVGRRVALAAVELVRQLVVHRERLQLEQEARKREEEETRLERARSAERSRLGLGARASFLSFPEGGWLLGPGLELEFNGELPLRIRAATDYRLGSIRMVEEGSSERYAWSHFDFSLAALWTKRLRRAEVELGLGGAVSAVHLGGGLESEQLTALSDTWSARLGLSAGALLPVGSWGRFRAGLSAGGVLRPVPYGQDGVATSLGGFFVGVETVLLVRP